MRSARKLSLHKESLTELTPADLGQVAGGAPTITTCAVSDMVHPCGISSPNPVCTVISRAVRPCITDEVC